MKQYSIRQLALRYSLLVLFMVLVLALTSFFIFKNFISSGSHGLQLRELTIKASSISHSVGVYREVVKQLAERHTVKDFILFSQVSEAQDWALDTKRLLPESIGLAVFNNKGEVLGHPATLSLGGMCVADMDRLIRGDSVEKPAVHTETSGKEHYDIAENIIHEGEVIGVLFASFNLRTVQARLDQIIAQGQKISIVSGSGQTIAVSGMLTEESYILEKQIPIPDTDWHMIATIEKQNLDDILISMALINIVLLIWVGAVFYFFSEKMAGIFLKEIDSIRKLLSIIKSNESDYDKLVPKLQDTKEVFHEIHSIVDDIDIKQKKLVRYSVTDELTGLSNRRALFDEMKRFVGLSNRGVDIIVVTLDLDYFKQMNDLMGHAVGDDLLVQFSLLLKAHTRSTDLCARVGGDEFWVVLVKFLESQLEPWYEGLVKDFHEKQKLILGNNKDVKLCGASAGYTEIRRDEKDIKDIMKRADKALYEAKSKGRGNISPSV
jgi:diguanylate cyclase (GGDEF)-like protein